MKNSIRVIIQVNFPNQRSFIHPIDMLGASNIILTRELVDGEFKEKVKDAFIESYYAETQENAQIAKEKLEESMEVVILGWSYFE